jgi:MYXO-CTERM domain-containing protein
MREVRAAPVKDPWPRDEPFRKKERFTETWHADEHDPDDGPGWVLWALGLAVAAGVAVIVRAVFR